MQQVSAFFSIFVNKARTMDDYEKRFQPDPEEVKKEKRTRILSNIATFLIVTSIMAGGYCITNWYKPTATDFDVFLFIYAWVAFFIGCVIQIPLSFDEDHSAMPWKWWM